ncbi:sugar ABC transporter substrate-binding protein [Bifidobacterium sp. LC6]|uniref:Sugar ABC transporter substrate-binding protein n=1 Tax=Bifidobacterium colobi TaxID=2809026 RepID=A0ABS5V0P5_9BIFI|nr:sugar ABC transporter substrate-binding protein [Bifidobacterium colobi]MBT1175798.1 sugar ABC transporter substrate-binding protein [Bifidobacterium colobi]
MSRLLCQVTRIRTAAATIAALSLLATAGCGSTSSENSTHSSSGTTEITLWTWQSTINDFVTAFEKTHPNIKVKVTNAGANEDEYMQLTNAINAGRGIPDVVYLDYNAVHQFAISDQLRNINDYGFGSIRGDFTKAAQNNVSVGGSPYGLPISSGPMVMFYNQDVFAKAGVTTAPTTWDEYRAAAEKIAALPGDAHIANDTGDGGFITSMLWQAGAQPFSVDGTNVSVNFSGKNVKKFTGMWQSMLDAKLIDTSTTGWTDEWWRKLDDGSIATMLTGAWMVSSMQKNLSQTKGSWRIALMPQYAAGEHTNGENGGGALALPKGTDDAKAKAAYEFAEWFAYGDGVKVNLAQGGLPPLNTVLTDSDWLNEKDSFFGGQATHQVIATASNDVSTKFEYLPYMAYANSIAVDSIGQAYHGKITLQNALVQWGDSLKTYGQQEGFTVK